MRAKRFPTGLLALFLLGLLVNLAGLTWPVCLPAGIAAAVWLFTRRSTHPLKSAAHAVLGPIAGGLLVLSALLFVFNVTSLPRDEEVLHTAERALVYLDAHAPRWTRLSFPVFVTVMTSLVALTVWLPRWRLVSGFVSVNKRVSKGVAALSAATSFTFFSNVAVVQPKAPEVYRKIEAIHRDSQVRSQEAVGRFLAARAVQRALTSMSDDHRAQARLAIVAIASAPDLSVPAKEALTSYVVTLRGGAASSAPVVGASIDPGRIARQASLTVLDRQLEAERTARVLADQMEKGVRELVVKTLDLGTDELKAIGWSLVDALIDVRSSELGRLAVAYGNKVADKLFERMTDPAITEWSKDVAKRLVGWTAAGPRPQAVVRSETHRALVAMSEGETASALRAADEAKNAAAAAKAAVDAGDITKAEAELEIAARASRTALKAAELGEAASRSVVKVVEGAPPGATARRVAIMADGTVDAAAALRAAGRAAQAARAAKATAEAVSAARSAKAAAQAVRAIKVFL